MADAPLSHQSERPGLYDLQDASSEPLIVGLVNNMPDGALRSTERQFAELLQASGRPVHLRIYSLPELPRSEAGRRHVEAAHRRLSELWLDKLDGLIVTGMVPRSSDFEQEPYWPSFAKLVDWADEHTISTVWSCLAAHAAVYRLDGISRRTHGGKLTGVFESTRRMHHPLLAGCPGHWPVPHSRHYEVPEAALLAAQYRILAGSDEVGADIFIKRRTALHLFLQGHPEYDAETLGLEYHRDVIRYLRGQSEGYPKCPRGYFEAASEARLRVFRDKAVPSRDAALIDQVPEARPFFDRAPPWQAVARLLYRNWVSYLAEQKSARRDVRAGQANPVDALLAGAVRASV